MTRAEAHALLDALRAGVYVPPEQIAAALVATGDLGQLLRFEPRDSLRDSPLSRVEGAA